MYDERAAAYDASNGGWHADLGFDFINWSSPPAGSKILDLACGTGLVTYPAAKATGPDGLVVGIDITPAMLQEAKSKTALQGSGSIKWIEHDICNLDGVKAVQDVAQNGGFDLIICCSALVLLADPAESIRRWAQLLKPGGRMIIDVPTEDKTVQRLWFHDLREAIGSPLVFHPNLIEDISSLEKWFFEAGLEVEKSWRTPSYLPETWYSKDEALNVLEEHIGKDKLFEDKGKMQKAREVWPEIWKRGVREDGRFWNGQCLYFTIGRKKLVK